MNSDGASAFPHRHRFDAGHSAGERRARLTMALTLATMAVEIAAGLVTGSMALLADGIHMATHGAALGIAAFTYAYARKHADDPRYSFGTGKVGTLGAYTSAILLGLVAAGMMWESAERLWHTPEIAFDEALAVAVLGLMVNLASAAILGGGNHDHGHGHSHCQDHSHGHAHEPHGGRDHNLNAAYVHVLTDALTSVLAIVALIGGKFWGWNWLDPAMGLVGAVVIAAWARGLLAEAACMLLDRNDDEARSDAVRRALESDAAGNRVADLHLWQVSSGHWAVIVSLVTAAPRPLDHYRALLAATLPLSHATIEIDARRNDRSDFP